MIKHIFKYSALAALLTAISLSSCVKEDFLPSHYDNDSTTQDFGNVEFKRRKVLLIAIDGLAGKTVQDMAPPVMSGLLPKSVYTFEGLTDTVTSVATGWATMTTGVPYIDHLIMDSTLIPKTVVGSHSEIKYYDNFIHFLKNDNLEFKVTAITPWDDINSFIIPQSDNVVSLGSSASTEDISNAAIDRLQTTNPDLMIVNFNQTALVGQQYGFGENVAEYSNAVLSIDQQIGKIMDALAARENYEKEEWLVVIQSTSGGAGHELGGKLSAQRNVFSIYYSPIIVPGKYTGPKILDKGLRLNGTPSTYVRAENPDDRYNINGSMTFEFKLKVNPREPGNYSYSYPPFFSKVKERYGSANPGYSFLKTGNEMVFWMCDGASTKEVKQTTAILDNNFHTVTGRADFDGQTYTMSIFLDGENRKDIQFTPANPITNDKPLVLGYWPAVFTDQYFDCYMADVRIWNTALPDEEIKELAVLSTVPSDHPHINNLIGNWSCDEGEGDQFIDASPSQSNFSIVGNYSWNPLGEILASSNRAPNLLDVTPTIYGWIGLTLEGSNKPQGNNYIRIIGKDN